MRPMLEVDSAKAHGMVEARALRALKRDFHKRRRGLLLLRRLAAFREQLTRTVTAISPLILDLGDLDGPALAAAVMRIRPSPPGSRLRYRHPTSAAIKYPPYYTKGSFFGAYLLDPIARKDVFFADRHAELGVVVRLPSDPKRRLGLKVVDDRLELELGINEHVLTTSGTTARLRLKLRLPETLVSGWGGRTMDGIVDHPLWNGRGYPVTAIEQDRGGTTCTIVFETGLRAFELVLDPPSMEDCAPQYFDSKA